MTDDRLYLINIVECIERIEAYTRGGKEAFLASTLIQDAVVRNFEIIGEATKRLSQPLKDQQPHIPWRRIAGLRDVLIHNYMGVDLTRVWGVVDGEMMDLKQAVLALLVTL
jgi:uncharacterized protein with HEPN domain